MNPKVMIGQIIQILRSYDNNDFQRVSGFEEIKKTVMKFYPSPTVVCSAICKHNKSGAGTCDMDFVYFEDRGVDGLDAPKCIDFEEAD